MSSVAVFSKPTESLLDRGFVGYNYSLTNSRGDNAYVIVAPDAGSAGLAKRILEAPSTQRILEKSGPLVQVQNITTSEAQLKREFDKFLHAFDKTEEEMSSLYPEMEDIRALPEILEEKLREAGKLDEFCSLGLKLLTFMNTKDIKIKIYTGIIAIFPLPSQLSKEHPVADVLLFIGTYMQHVMEKGKVTPLNLVSEINQHSRKGSPESLLPPVSQHQYMMNLVRNSLSKFEHVDYLSPLLKLMATEEHFQRVEESLSSFEESYFTGKFSNYDRRILEGAFKSTRSPQEMKLMASLIDQRMEKGDTPLFVLPLSDFEMNPFFKKCFAIERINVERIVPPANGILYKIDSPDGTHKGFLYGTIHKCSKSMANLSKQIVACLKNTDTLYLETQLDDPRIVEKNRFLKQKRIRQFASLTNTQLGERVCAMKDELFECLSLKEKEEVTRKLSTIQGNPKKFLFLAKYQLNFLEKILKGEDQQWPVCSIEAELYSLAKQHGINVRGINSVENELESLSVVDEAADHCAKGKEFVQQKELEVRAWQQGNEKILNVLHLPCSTAETKYNDVIYGVRDPQFFEGIKKVMSTLSPHKLGFYAVGWMHIQGLKTYFKQAGFHLTRLNKNLCRERQPKKIRRSLISRKLKAASYRAQNHLFGGAA